MELARQVPNPEFEGQTKTRLGNPEARRVVDVVVSEFLLDFFDVKQNVLSTIVQRALQVCLRVRFLSTRRARAWHVCVCVWAPE